MPIITLTTDLGLRDYYLGAVKGAILEACPTATIIDISNQIEAFNIVEAAFILKNAYHEFPDGTIHIISVNAMDDKNTRHLCIHHQDQYFVGPDNGIFSLIFNDYPHDIYELSHNMTASTFPAKELYAGAACNIANGQSPDTFGEPVRTIQQRTALQPVLQESFIRGTVIHTDDYENVITNISRELFDAHRKDRGFALFFNRYDSLNKLSEHYYDVPVGEMLCLFNESGYLEIAINKGKAASLLGLDIGDTVQIDFT